MALFAVVVVAYSSPVENRALGEELLARAIERHGGQDLWQRVCGIEFVVDSLAGPLPWAKGLHRMLQLPQRVRLEPQCGRVIWPEWPDPGLRGVYKDGRVAIVSQSIPAANEPLPAESHRLTFTGRRKWRRWRELDALYFFGYALAHYLALPFSLVNAELMFARSLADGGGELWFRFPAAWHTHSRCEGFRFDRSGLLIRHDYRAEIIGQAACGAHRSLDYVEVEGLPLAQRRRVSAKIGHSWRALCTPIPVLRADLGSWHVELAD